jgi:hypothetical protein
MFLADTYGLEYWKRLRLDAIHHMILLLSDFAQKNASQNYADQFPVYQQGHSASMPPVALLQQHIPLQIEVTPDEQINVLDGYRKI